MNMKISLWQQFSSNHSGSFSVVGRFATEEAAREAAEKLREIVRRIDAWHENPANQAWYSEADQKSVGPPITPVEVAIAKEFNVAWGNGGADWYGGMHAPIQQVGRDVYFSTAESWSMPTPIVNLLKSFGGETAQSMSYEDEAIETIWVKLTCRFNDEAAAQATCALVTPFMHATRQSETKPPWAGDSDGRKYLGFGDISCEGTRLQLDYRFYGLSMGLPAMVEWLQRSGAQNIDYTFATRKSGEY
jgi:hypothetical protein